MPANAQNRSSKNLQELQDGHDHCLNSIETIFKIQYYYMPVINLTLKDFKDKIFDFENEKEWKYVGNKPAIIDFYADWCGPCKAVAPVLDELAVEFENEIIIYKVDTDKEAEMSSMFGIQSIPTFLFIPVGEPPMIQNGAIPKKAFEKVIRERLLDKTTQPG